MFVLLLPSVTSYCYFRGMSHTLAHATTWLVMAHTVAIWLKSIRHSAYQANCQLWQQKFSTADRSVAMVVVASGWWWPAIITICVIVFIIAVKYIDMKVKAAKEKRIRALPSPPSPRRPVVPFGRRVIRTKSREPTFQEVWEARERHRRSRPPSRSRSRRSSESSE